MFAKKNTKSFFLFSLFSFFFLFLPFSFFEGFFSLHENTLLIASAQSYNLWSGGWEGILVYFLLMILNVLASFLSATISLLTQFIDARTLTGLIDNKAVIYPAWQTIRDVCNLAFIFTLLFSAFATIFHVDKYHIKTLFGKLLIVALLINFSFPITRFVIDTGNVPMYYMAQILFGNSSTTNIGTQISDNANIVCAFVPYDTGCKGRQITELEYGTKMINQTSTLFASIIMIFLFTITMFVLAGLFMIRTIALAILIIFSPLGFIGLAVPALSKYANEFWENLVKYTFFGPVMLFVLAVSVKVISAMNIQAVSLSQNPGTGGIASAIQAIAVPIVILWIGMAIAQKANIWGANTIIGAAEKVAKWPAQKAQKWGMNRVKSISGWNRLQRNLKSYSGERAKRRQELFKNNLGEKTGNILNRAQDTVYEKFGSKKAKKRLEGMRESTNRETVSKERAKVLDSGTSTEQMVKESSKAIDATTGNVIAGNITKDIAGHASAYVTKHGDDQRAEIVMQVRSKNGFSGTEFKNLIQGFDSATLTQIESEILSGGKISEENMRLLVKHVNNKMNTIVNEFTKNNG